MTAIAPMTNPSTNPPRSSTTQNLPARTEEVKLEPHRAGNQSYRVPSVTEPTSSPQTAPITSTPSPSLSPKLTNVPGVRAVRAVIGDSIGEGNVVVHCYPPHSPTFEIRLRDVVIPTALRRYGQPVFVSIDVQNGIRKPIITERQLDAPVKSLPGQEDIEQWLDSLD